MKRIVTNSMACLLLAGVTFGMGVNTAIADDDAKIEARIGKWGTNCKNKVAERVNAPMSDIHVTLGATEQTSIDAGDITLDDLKQYGLSFNWEVGGRGGSASGYCNTDGQGNVTEFVQNSNGNMNSQSSSGDDEDAKIQRHIEKWGQHCKKRVAKKLGASMSDIRVSVGATEQSAIDAGDTTLKDIKRYGLSFNWEVNGRGGSQSGYCNTDGEGNIVDFNY